MNLRANREKNAHDIGFIGKRKFYTSLFSHCKYLYYQRSIDIIKRLLKDAENLRVLEIGSAIWYDWIFQNNINPKEIVCINISEHYLNDGIQKSRDSGLNIDFKLMDANNLFFDNESFDIVIGGQILHHLDFTSAISEINRVLKPDGQIIFREPLGINPVSKIIRKITSSYRTKDESPLSEDDFKVIEKYFLTKYYYEQLFSVPAGFVSRFIYKEPDNMITRTALKIDLYLDNTMPLLRKYFRHLLIHGYKK